MPRLTNVSYLQNREWLAELWHGRRRPDLRYLSYKQQMELHRYYEFAEGMSDAEALKHREAVTWHRPSLPQQAGRALAELRRVNAVVTKMLAEEVASPAAAHAARTRHVKKRNVTVRVVARPEIDVHRLALAIVNQALAEVRGEMDSKTSGPRGSGRTVR